MKTKMAFVALLMMIGVAQVRADAKGPSLKVSHKDGSGVFLINYLSNQKQDVKVTIKDITGQVLTSETLKGVKDFSLPVNLEGVGEGIYTVEVGNKTVKQIETLDYTNQAPISKTFVSQVGENRYLLSVAHAGSEFINIKILNDAGNIVYQNHEMINGNFARVYEVDNSNGTPSFEVTNLAGDSLIGR